MSSSTEFSDHAFFADLIEAFVFLSFFSPTIMHCKAGPALFDESQAHSFAYACCLVFIVKPYVVVN